MRSIVRSIYEHSLRMPEKVAVIADDTTVTYRVFWNMISAISVLLQRAGLKKGERVILEAGPTVEFLAFCYGIHLSEAVHVPVEKDIPEARINEIAAEIEPAMIFRGYHPLAALGVGLDDLQNTASDVSNFPSEEMLQEILYTTGTTGKSKGVMITHYGQMNMCESQNAVLSYSEDNVWLIPTPMNHAAGLRKTHMSMVRGSTVLIMDGFKDLKRFFQNMNDYHVTSVYLPPAGVHYILTLAAKELAKFDEQLDFLYSSSSALPGGDKEKLIQYLPHVRMFDAYGGSEVGAVVYIDYNHVRKGAGCVGKPNPGVDVFIVDEEYRPISATRDEPGIIAIRSNTVTAGYWHEPELTKRTIVDGVIYMSDLGYLDEDGYLYLVGRRDDVINVGGLKVSPTEVEDIALRFDPIAECVCIPYEQPGYGRCVKMLVKLKPDKTFDPESITQFLAERLEAYKIPKFIERIAEVPVTFNGKIDRKRAISLYSNLS